MKTGFRFQVSDCRLVALGLCALLACQTALAETPAERKARMVHETEVRARLKALESEASQLLNPTKKNRPAEGWEVQRKIVEDGEFALVARLNALKGLLGGTGRSKDVEVKMKYVPFAKEVLAKETKLTAAQKAEVMALVLDAEIGAGRKAEAKADAAALADDAAAADKAKEKALIYLVRDALAHEGEKAAFALCDRRPKGDRTAAVARSWILEENYRFEDAAKALEDAGLDFEAAQFWCDDRHRDSERALALYRKVLADETQPRANRTTAYDYLIRYDLPLARKMLPWRLSGSANDTNYAIRAINWKIGRGQESTYYGRFEETARLFAFIREACALARKDVYPEAAFYGVLAKAALGDTAGAAADAAALKESKSWKPADRYCLAMLSALITEHGEADGLFARVQAADRKFAGELASKDRVKYIERVGSVAMLANNENLVRALNRFRLSLYVPQPKKRYTVKYVARPIEGLGGFEAALKEAEVAKLDRSYGGNLDFLVTDVASGDRGEGIGTDASGKKDPPEMRILCDAFGIHFRYDIPEAETAKVLAGEASAGSFESYIAPGDNEPYTCFMYNIAKKSLSFYGTTYDCPGHRRMRVEAQDLSKCDAAFREGKTVGYYFFSWKNWLERAPKDGDEWDFEPIFWTRQGNFAWNGTASIHGRSTWGRLVFSIPAEGRAAILRNLLYAAKQHYKDARKAGAGVVGVFNLWEDPVMGDPEFFAAAVKPLEERLNAGLDKVGSQMSDAEVVPLAETYLSDWWNIEYLVQKARVAWRGCNLTVAK